MVVARVLRVSALLLVSLPVVAADPVDEVNGSLCSTVWSYFCAHPVGGPQDPGDAAQPFLDAVNGPLCSTVWSYFCAYPLGGPQDVHDAAQPFLDVVNGPLCSTVWSYFCANPVRVP